MDEGFTSARPLRRDAERNRQLILSAARTLFAQRGLDASLDDVAHEAGLGVGTVYRRFPNREALIDALFDDGLEAITEIVQTAQAAPRAWDGLRHFMASMLELQAADRAMSSSPAGSQNPNATAPGTGSSPRWSRWWPGPSGKAICVPT